MSDVCRTPAPLLGGDARVCNKMVGGKKKKIIGAKKRTGFTLQPWTHQRLLPVCSTTSSSGSF